MIRWILNLFSKHKNTKSIAKPENVDSDDEVMREVISRCYNSGNMIYANIDNDGTVHYSDDEED